MRDSIILPLSTHSASISGGSFWRKRMMEEQIQALQSPHSRNREGADGDDAVGSPDLRSRAHSRVPINSQVVFEPVLDSEEAAALLHIHPKTLQRLARSGEIPGFRIGKLWGFRASVLNEWLESKLRADADGSASCGRSTYARRLG